MIQPRSLRIVHLFPDVLRVYGDGGNVATLVGRARARSIATSVVRVRVGADRLPPADLIFIGGGQDREQETVARELERLGDQLIDAVAEGAALLAVCGGYQNLGQRYRTSSGTDLPCPGLLPVTTDGSGGGRRLVGPVVANVAAGLLSGMSGGGQPRGAHRSIVGFENHGGRTVLCAGARAFATVEIGHGNNDVDATEGVLLLPNEGGLRGLRIGTYLHGPLLPRNPHIADALIANALGRGHEPVELAPLDDRLDWAAHDGACARLRRSARRDRRLPGWAHRAFDPIGRSSAIEVWPPAPVDPVVAGQQAARFGEEGQAVGSTTDPDDPDQATSVRVDDRSRPPEPIGDPQPVAVGRHRDHVGRAADPPRPDDPAGRDVDDRERPRKPVRDVQPARVATDGKTVGTPARPEEGDPSDVKAIPRQPGCAGTDTMTGSCSACRWLHTRVHEP